MEAKINLAMLNNNKCSSVEFEGSNIASTNGHLVPTIVSAVTVASSPSLTHMSTVPRVVSESTVHVTLPVAVPVRPIEHRPVSTNFSSKHACTRGKKGTFLRDQTPAAVRDELPQWYSRQ